MSFSISIQVSLPCKIKVVLQLKGETKTECGNRGFCQSKKRVSLMINMCGLTYTFILNSRYIRLKIISVVNFIRSKFFRFASTCLISSAHWVKYKYRELRRLSACYKMFLGLLTVVTYKIYFSQHCDFSYNIYKSMANCNSKQHVLLMD